MIEAIINVVVPIFIGIVLSILIIRYKNKKDKRSLLNMINAVCEEHANFLNKMCNVIHEEYTDEEKEILVEGADISFEDSKKNLIEEVKDIYFAPITRFKLPLKSAINYLDKFFEKDLMPRDMNDSLVDLEKNDIGTGLYLYYFLKYRMYMYSTNEQLTDDDIEFIHVTYMDSLKFTDFRAIPVKDPMCKVYSTHVNGVLSDKHYYDENNDYHIFFQDDCYMKKSNFLSLSRFMFTDSDVKYDVDKDQFHSLLYAKSEKDLREYKKEWYSEKFKKEFGSSFNDILNDDDKLPLWHIVDEPLEFGKYAKVLMYLDLDKKKIKFKEFVKNSDEENYHTIRNRDDYAGLWIYEYVMYLESFIYLSLNDIIDKEENEDGKIKSIGSKIQIQI